MANPVIVEYAAKQNAFTDRVDSAVTGLIADVEELNRQIKALQDNPGAITPEDQAILDALTARGQTVAEKLEALDALTPPPTPPPV